MNNSTNISHNNIFFNPIKTDSEQQRERDIVEKNKEKIDTALKNLEQQLRNYLETLKTKPNSEELSLLQKPKKVFPFLFEQLKGEMDRSNLIQLVSKQFVSQLTTCLKLDKEIGE